MRTCLSALLVAAAIAQPAAAATRNFGVTSFERVRVEGPYRVQLATGVAPFAKATGGTAALDRVSIEVQGTTLTIRSNPSWGGYPGQDLGPVDIQVGTHDLTTASLNGSGSLRIDKARGLTFTLTAIGSGMAQIDRAQVDNLKLTSFGPAAMKVGGQTGKLSVLVRGMGNLDATGLVAKDADLGAEGAAAISAQVTNAAKVSASGVATVTLSGNPSCTSTVSGSATVSGCR